jgi:GTP pyrophosphokinase
LNSLTSTTRTEHRASLRKWKMSASRPQIFAVGTAHTVEDMHSRQMEKIHKALLKMALDAKCELVEPPFAYVWDDEARAYFKSIGIKTRDNPRFYSSVHYVFRPNSGANVTCELQVRTLADELWGEIDHKLNYPLEHKSLACREQIKVLSRLSSSCGRLVDSIVASHDEFEARQESSRRAASRRRKSRRTQ